MKIKTLLLIALLLTFGQVAWAQIDLSQGDFTEGFENSESFHGNWQVVQLLENAYYGIVGDTHHNGGYSFSLCSGANPYGYLISPEFTGTGQGAHVEFFYSTKYVEQNSSFEVGYSLTNNAIGSFTWYDPVVAVPGNLWNEYEEDFPVGVKYIAVRVSQNNDYLFVDDFTFSAALCAIPSKPVAGSVSTNSIPLSWTGSNDSYELQYTPYNLTDFEAGWNGWTSFDANGHTGTWAIGNDLTSPIGQYSAYSSLKNHKHDNYLVSPWMALGGELDFYVMCEGSGETPALKGENPNVECRVYVSFVQNPGIDDFESEPIISFIARNGSWESKSIDLSEYNGRMGHVAICHVYQASSATPEEFFYLDVDDITILPPDGKTTVSGITNTNYTISNLVPETNYAIQLRGVCGEGLYSNWTNVLNVKTAKNNNALVFNTAGSWYNTANWVGGNLPTLNDDVIIKANVTIPYDANHPEYVALAKTITIQPGYILTIEDGGQLKHNNSGVLAIVNKNIIPIVDNTGYDHYYLLASPMVNDISIASSTNFANSSFDLYSFDQNEDLEWINYWQSATDLNNHGFTTLANKVGYLYASEQATATIMGQLMRSDIDVEVNLTYNDAVTCKGWNLLGNPFMCNAYVGRDYYRLVEGTEESELVLASGAEAIAPLEGVFVQAANANDIVTFTRTVPSRNETALNMNVIRKGNRIDMARVRFGEGRGLEKFQLNPNHTKVYLQMGDKDYAVICAEGVMGELPVSFKVAESGNYALDFTFENVDFSYLHLIDNLTGDDVNLLANPKYSFEAQTTDFAMRFKLVYAMGSSVEDDSFGFIRDGHLLVLGNESEATLQIFDMTGRMMSSEQFVGSYDKPFETAPGVYVIRLINGNDVKVQKIVVK